MTRILALSAFYPPHHFGGYELACRDVVARWRRLGHDVHVLTSDVRFPDVTGDDEQQVHRGLRIYWRDHQAWSPHPLVRLRIERHNQRVFGELLDRVKPEVVSFWHMAGMSMGLLTTIVERGIPFVCVLQDNWLVFGPQKDAWARLYLDRPRAARVVRALARVPTAPADIGPSGAFCFVSEWTRRHAVDKSRWQFPVSSVVYSGVDPETFLPRQPIDRPWSWRLLYAGRLDQLKGIDTVIRALALLPAEARLTVSGRGNPAYRDELLRLAAELGVADRIDWVNVSRAELRELYSDADVLIFPSRWAEPFGLVLVEAMACGTPVVATGTGGSGEFCVDEFNCLRFPADDASALAERVRRLSDDPSLRRRIVDGGLATTQDLTIDRLAIVLDDWHRAAAERFAHGVPGDRQLQLAAS